MTPSAVSPSATTTEHDDLPAPPWPGGAAVGPAPGSYGAWPTNFGRATSTGVSWSGLIEQPAPGAGPHRIRAISACAADTGVHDPFADTGPLPAVASTVASTTTEAATGATGAATGAATTRAAATVAAAPAPAAAPGTDPLSDTTPVGGLHKFDLGMVPASVTPPRSSRRAAWFAVLSAGAVLSGLLLIATTLVSPTTSIDALQLPRMPRATQFPAPAPEPHARHPHTQRPDALADRVPGPGIAPPPGPAQPEAPGAADLPPAPAPEHGAPGPVPGAGDYPAPVDEAPEAAPQAPPRPPAPVTYRDELLSFADPQLVAARSADYFGAISSHDLAGAYAGTTGRLRAAGFDAFAERYRDAAAVEVLSVSATSASTVTTLRITGADGSVREQQRRLRFTPGANPRVYADDAA
ncbi:hypothetical protein ABZ805_09080 [Saccharopolyspora sp. NPDC047091]|uniref:hypothetical protein n=1 Tax=Saccharopolyspora sp. NPDC047091 TaxID=3155924 RepID=UPI0033DA3A57